MLDLRAHTRKHRRGNELHGPALQIRWWKWEIRLRLPSDTLHATDTWRGQLCTAILGNGADTANTRNHRRNEESGSVCTAHGLYVHGGGDEEGERRESDGFRTCAATGCWWVWTSYSSEPDDPADKSF